MGAGSWGSGRRGRRRSGVDAGELLGSTTCSGTAASPVPAASLYQWTRNRFSGCALVGLHRRQGGADRVRDPSRIGELGERGQQDSRLAQALGGPVVHTLVDDAVFESQCRHGPPMYVPAPPATLAAVVMPEGGRMSTFALVHGGAHGGWCWELVVPELERLGHSVVAPDLPIEDEANGARAWADVVVEALEGVGDDVVVVGHSLGGMAVPVVASLRPVRRMVFLAAMVPVPGMVYLDVPGDAARCRDVLDGHQPGPG